MNHFQLKDSTVQPFKSRMSLESSLILSLFFFLNYFTNFHNFLPFEKAQKKLLSLIFFYASDVFSVRRICVCKITDYYSYVWCDMFVCVIYVWKNFMFYFSSLSIEPSSPLFFFLSFFFLSFTLKKINWLLELYGLNSHTKHLWGGLRNFSVVENVEKKWTALQFSFVLCLVH